MNIKENKEGYITKGYQGVFYCPPIDTYFLEEVVPWICYYERYYVITKDDYELFSKDLEAFNKKYEKEHSQKATQCFTENFAGSENLRDYDGIPDFQKTYPSDDGNPFNHYTFIDNVLYANIKWNHDTILVPPVQVIQNEKDGTTDYPLREKCMIQTDPNGEKICYKLKENFKP
eukprot:jgi/Orpsp1_1/1190810/evm.model.d7180000081346.1